MTDARRGRRLVRVDDQEVVPTATPHTPFVGRDAELRTLRALLARPAEHATVVLVAGDPGIGKSRLITESLRDTARQVLATGPAEVALRVLRERTGTRQPHRPADRVDTVPAPRDPPERRQDPAGADPMNLVDLVERPSVLMLDDLHRADAATLEFVRACATRPPAVPLVLVGGYRPASAVPALLATVADGLACGTVTELVLGPLTEAALAELTACTDEERAGLAACDGNPRWAQFALGRAAVEVTVRAELARLPVAHLALLRSLAVFGGEADLALLAAACQPADGAALGARLGELTETGLLVHDERSGTARFRYPRIRELVYAGLDPVAKADAHRGAARARHVVGAPAEDRAAHLEHLGGDLEADDVRALLDAARELLWRAPATAARWLDAALRAPADRWPADADRTDATIVLGQAQALAGDLPAGRATLHDVLAGVQEIAPDRRWQIAAAGSLVERFLGRFPEASQVLAGAAEWLPDGEPALGLAVERGAIALLDNNYPHAADQMHDAARTSRPATAQARAAVLTMAGLGAASQVDVERAGGYLDEAAALVDAASDVALVGSVETLSRQGWAELYLERFADAERHFRRGITLAEGNGQQALLPPLLLGQTQALLWTRSLPAAQHTCDRALELAVASGSEASRSFALALQAQLQTWSSPVGTSAHAVATAEEALACANRRTLWGQTAVAILACAQVMAGQPAQCVSTFLELAGGVELTEAQPMYRTLWYRTMTGASVLAGDIAGARDFAARAGAHADDTLPSHRALRAAAQADVDAVLGKLDDALPGYQLAADEFDGCDWALHRDWTLACAGTLLVTFGRHAEAVEWLRRGRAGAARCGIRATVALADTALSHIEPATVDAPQLDVLTLRQREIVKLVLAGHSNRDIAGHLSLSARTVESHLANAYRAMGISSRAELATMVAGQRIRPLTGEPGPTGLLPG